MIVKDRVHNFILFCVDLFFVRPLIFTKKFSSPTAHYLPQDLLHSMSELSFPIVRKVEGHFSTV